MTGVVPTRGSTIRLRQKSSGITHVIATAVGNTVPASLPWQAVPPRPVRPLRPISTSRWDGGCRDRTYVKRKGWVRVKRLGNDQGINERIWWVRSSQRHLRDLKQGTNEIIMKAEICGKCWDALYSNEDNIPS